MPTAHTPQTAAHRTSVQASLSDIAAFLQENFGQKLVAHMVGVQDPKSVGRWATGQRVPKNPEYELRLRTIHQVFTLLAEAEAPDTVRAWFVGLNPQLGDESPAAAIGEGRLKDVLGAARAFLAGG